MSVRPSLTTIGLAAGQLAVLKASPAIGSIKYRPGDARPWIKTSTFGYSLLSSPEGKAQAAQSGVDISQIQGGTVDAPEGSKAPGTAEFEGKVVHPMGYTGKVQEGEYITKPDGSIWEKYTKFNYRKVRDAGAVEDKKDEKKIDEPAPDDTFYLDVRGRVNLQAASHGFYNLKRDELNALISHFGGNPNMPYADKKQFYVDNVAPKIWQEKQDELKADTVSLKEFQPMYSNRDIQLVSSSIVGGKTAKDNEYWEMDIVANDFSKFPESDRQIAADLAKIYDKSRSVSRLSTALATLMLRVSRDKFALASYEDPLIRQKIQLWIVLLYRRRARV